MAGIAADRITSFLAGCRSHALAGARRSGNGGGRAGVRPVEATPAKAATATRISSPPSQIRRQYPPVPPRRFHERHNTRADQDRYPAGHPVGQLQLNHISPISPSLLWRMQTGRSIVSTVAPNVELAIWLISTGGETFASPTNRDRSFTHGKRPDPCPVANDVGHGVFHAMRLSPDRRTFMMIDNNQGKAQFF